MNSTIKVQIPNKIVCISVFTNAAAGRFSFFRPSKEKENEQY